MPLRMRKKKEESEEIPFEEEEELGFIIKEESEGFPEEKKAYEETSSSVEAIEYEKEKKEAPLAVEEVGSSFPGSKMVVRVSEEEDCTFNYLGNVEQRSGKGKIWVENNSKDEKIANVELKISNTDNTTIPMEKMKIANIRPGKTSMDETPVEYEITEFKEKQPLIAFKIDEGTYQDTMKQLGKNFVIQSKMALRTIIELSNLRENPIQNCVLTRSYPPPFEGAEVNKVSTGETSVEENKVTWKFELGPNSTQKIVVDTFVTPQDISSIKTGNATFSFNVDSETLSGVNVETPKALCEYNYAVEKTQDDKDPTKWTLKIEIANISEFPIRIDSIAVHKADLDGEKISEIKELGVGKPGQTLSESVTHYSENIEEVPTFGLDFDVSAVPEIKKMVSGKYIFDGWEIPVASVSMEKTYIEPKTMEKTDQVICGSKEPITARISITNIGGIALDKLSIVDQIPEGFVPPKPSEVSVHIKEDGRPVQSGAALTPDTESPDRPHTVELVAENMLENIGGLEPSRTLIMDYPIIPLRVRPGVVYKSVPEGLANTKPLGPEIIINAPSEAEVPTLTAIHKPVTMRVEKAVTLEQKTAGDTEEKKPEESKKVYKV